MSFLFGFSGDDIEGDGQNEEQAGDLVDEMLKHSISEQALAHSQTIKPNVHTLRELVSFQFLIGTRWHAICERYSCLMKKICTSSSRSMCHKA